MSQEHEDESADRPEDKSDSNGFESREHKKYRPPGLCPRYMKDDRISFSELSCSNIGQIETMLENMYGGVVGSAVFVPGGLYGFFVTLAEVSEILGDGGLAVNIESRIFSLDTSASFASPHCGKWRHQLHQDYKLSCMVKVKDKAIVSSLDENRDNIPDIFKIINKIEYSIVSPDHDSVITSGDAYKRIPHVIQRYLNNVDTEEIPFLLRREHVSLLSGKQNYSKVSS